MVGIPGIYLLGFFFFFFEVCPWCFSRDCGIIKDDAHHKSRKRQQFDS
jgi:hypothetical protein